MATLLIGPKGRNPDRARGEHQYAKINEAQTAVLVGAGGGQVVGVVVGVAGTLAKFYDVAAGGVTDDTTEIMTLSLATVGDYDAPAFAFSAGLTVVVTGSAAELTVFFDYGGNAAGPLSEGCTVSPLFFNSSGGGLAN